MGSIALDAAIEASGAHGGPGEAGIGTRSRPAMWSAGRHFWGLRPLVWTAMAEAAVPLKATAEGTSGLGMTTLVRWSSRRGRDESAPYGAELRCQQGLTGCRGPIHGAGGRTFEIERVAALAWRQQTLGVPPGWAPLVVSELLRSEEAVVTTRRVDFGERGGTHRRGM
ncbi:putative formin-like protein 5 [Iris pallida]|uniref:Formin-like protein 5 n=1 Tax=Iris pallida TaxID=29817 RepID=A0AAX6GYP6_IRIPA|nr:putative formin-like protein 5 [Iris pallida]